MWCRAGLGFGVVALVAACAQGDVVDVQAPDGVVAGQEEPVLEPAMPELPTQGEPIGVAPMLRPELSVTGPRSAAGAVVMSEDEAVAYVVDADNGMVHRFDTATGELRSLAVGAEPTRLVRAGDDLWVTLRGAGEVVRLHDDGTGLVETDRVEVGAEPYGLALAPEEPWLFVALSQEDAVVALDARTLEPIGRWPAPGEPKWLSTTDDGRLAVVPARLPNVGRYTVTTGAIGWATLPSIRRFESPECPDRRLARRVTGDPAMGPGDTLVLPVLLADTDLRGSERRGEDPRNGHTGFSDTGGPPPDAEPGPDGTVPGREPMPDEPFCSEGGEAGSYGSSGDPSFPGAIGRLTPSLVRVDLDRLVATQTATLGSNLMIDPAAHNGEFGPNGMGMPFSTVRSYPGAVRLTDDGETAWVAMPGSSAFVVVRLDQSAAEKLVQLFSPLRGAFPTDLGVDSVVPLSGDRVLLGSPLGRSLQVGGFTPDLMPDPFLPSEGLFEPVVGASLPLSALPADVQAGRRLFHSSVDQRMAAASSGVSCETCHTEGRNDGFTWVFDDMPRQTPSLAGPVEDTLPLTWLGEVETIVDEIHATTQTRMGGRGLDEASAAKVAAYVAWTRAPHRPAPRTEAGHQAVARGKALFESTEVGCARCHDGSAHADGSSWRVLGFEERTNTPTLRGIGGSAPYFHDGSAATLRDVLLRVRDGSMGDTSMLSDTELDDLEAYLRTL
ncbi:MAG: c-type cytochrome [Alphaproteobacteria bacterium]|nr:c-type cytochrome [Alphaproteobacteria bacterium]